MSYFGKSILFGRRKILWNSVAIFGAGLFYLSNPVLAETTKPVVIDLEISKRKVTSSDKTVRVSQGQQVQINWTTDERVMMHLHGYDISVILTPGETVSMTFKAVTAGRFPITAHNYDHHALVYLEIYPE